MKKIKIENNIRKLRFHADEMTQQQLAEAVGVTRQTIMSIEKGKYSPSLELAFRMARVFGTSIDQVFTFIETDIEIKKTSARQAITFKNQAFSNPIQRVIFLTLNHHEYEYLNFSHQH